MNKKTSVWIVLLILVLLVGSLGIWQKNNIDALLLSRRMSQSELSDKITEQQEKTVELSRQAGVSVRSLTEEERAEIRGQKISREELIDRLLDRQTEAPAETAAPSPTPDTAAPEPSAEPTQQPEPDGSAALRDKLAECVARIYVMEAEYSGWLEQANQDAIDEFNALPEAERTSSAKFNIGMKYLSLAKDKEKACDEEMAALEEEIRTLLRQLGESTALADEIHSAYLEEKAAKKAYYLGLH